MKIRNLTQVPDAVLAAAKALDEMRPKLTQAQTVRKDQPKGATNELMLYGVIGDYWSYLDAQSVIERVKAMGDVAEIVVRINSGGGYLFEGLAIFNYLANHPARIIVRVDGLAASMASVIAMAGDVISIPENAFLMIHNPWNIVAGNADDLRREADLLDQMKGSLVSIYAEVTGIEREEIARMMDEETWLNGVQALELGFATETSEPLAAAAMALPPVKNFTFKNAPAPLKADIGRASATVPPAVQIEEPHNMLTAEQKAAAEAEAKKIRDEAAKAERARALEIRKAVQNAKLKGEIADKLIEDGVSIDEARAQIIDMMADASNSLPSTDNKVRITVGADAIDKFRAGAMAAISAKAGIAKDDPANEFRGYSLVEFARMSLENHGEHTRGMDKMKMVKAALTHSTSDFPYILENIANKSMMKGFEEADETFQKWTTPGVLTDFKVNSRVDTTAVPALQAVGEGSEYKYATIGERKETIQLATYGNLFSITRQAIINDDLSAFTKVPQKMGRAAIRTIGNLVYAVLNGNPNMADSVALFHTATHKNLASSGAAPSVTTVDAARAAMATQKDRKDSSITNNVRPRYALSPVAIGGVFRQLIASQFDPSKTTQIANPIKDLVEVIDDARLDASSTTAWYLVADGSIYDTLEVAYLDGVQTPTLEQHEPWKNDGIEYKIRIDAGVKALAWETFYKNPGA
jgi:ATP-dependent protease ClpP protease subunit